MNKTKICRVCKEEKLIKSFGKWHDKKHEKYYIKTICNTCQGKYYKTLPSSKSVRKRISEKHKEKYQKMKPLIKEKLKELHRHHTCQMCGFDNPTSLCYHHRNPSRKSFSITWAFQHGYGLSRLLKEIKKCDLLCQNCHTKIHTKVIDNSKRWNRKAKLLNGIGQTKCIKCGNDDIRCLSFHHRNPTEKTFTITHRLMYRYEDVLKESMKCDILCANCHTLHHTIK